MNKNISVLYVVVIFLCFVAIIYTLSYRLNFFPWGSSKHDGLFVIVIPIWILPAVYVFSFIRWLITRKENSFKANRGTSLAIYVMGATFIGFLVLFDYQFLYWFCFFLSIILMVLAGKDILFFLKK
jgi:hypothetical protein